MKKIIAIDVDRTLVDSFEHELISLQEAIENVTGMKIDNELMSKLTTLPTKVFFKSLNLTDEQLKDINDEWERTYAKGKTLCFPGMKEVIKTLYNKGYTLAIITSRNTNEYHELDYELDTIKDYFKVVITSDLVDNPKPSIDSMNYLCNKLNCSTDDVIYLGDSNIDKTFAKNTNVTFIPCCYENKELINEEYKCMNPIELIKMIEDINK